MADELDNLEMQILAWLDGELDAAATAELQRKLAASPQYAHLLAELQQQREALASVTPVTVPPELSRKLQDQVRTSQPNGLTFGRRYRLAASVLLMVGVAAVAYQMLPQRAGMAPQMAGDRPAAYPQGYTAIPVNSAPVGEDTALGLRELPGAAALSMANLASPRQTVIYVASSDPIAAGQQVTSLLRSNGIQFSQASGDWAGRPAAELAEGPVSAASGEKRLASSIDRRRADKLADAQAKEEQVAAAPPAAAITAVPAATPAPVAPAETFPSRRKEAAAAPVLPRPATQPPAAGMRQQVFVARNLRASDIANVEKALQGSDGARQASRVLSVSNSQQQLADRSSKLLAGEASQSASQRQVSRDAELAKQNQVLADAAKDSGFELLIVVDADSAVSAAKPAAAEVKATTQDAYRGK